MENSDSDDDSDGDSDDDYFMVDQTAASKKRRRLKSISVLEKEDSFSPRTRNKMDELVVEFLHKTRVDTHDNSCLLYTSPSPRDLQGSRMPSSA